MKRTLLVKIVAVLCVTLMVTIFVTACQTPAGNDQAPTPAGSNQTPTTAPSAQEPAGQTEKSYDKHLVISASVIGAEKAGLQEDGSEAGNYAWLKEKFNFEFEFWPLTWGNYVDQTRLWMASSETPDLIMMDIAPVRYSEFVNWVKEGLLQPYPDLNKYPEIKRVMDNATTGKKFIIDGKMYAYPAYTDDFMLDLVPVKGYTLAAYIYRKDWAEAVGLRKENDVYTLDEWRTLVKTIIEKDPGKNGPGKTVGIITKNWAFGKFNGGGNLSPYMYQYGKDANGNYVWGPQLPETLEAIKLMKEMYDEGVIWKDQVIVQDSDLGNYFNAGLAVAVQHGNTTINGVYNTAVEFEKGTGLKAEDAIGLALVKGPNDKILTYQGNGQWSQTGLSPRMSAGKVERWCDILNYLVSEEGYYFRTLGIPGKDWGWVDGKPVDKWSVDENGNKINPYWTQGTTPWQRMASSWDGFSYISPAYPKWIQDLVYNARKTIEDKGIAQLIPVDIELAYFSGPEYSKVGTKEKEIYEKVASLMVSNNLEAEWKAWVESKMPEIQPALDELNASLK